MAIIQYLCTGDIYWPFTVHRSAIHSFSAPLTYCMDLLAIKMRTDRENGSHR